MTNKQYKTRKIEVKWADILGYDTDKFQEKCLGQNYNGDPIQIRVVGKYHIPEGGDSAYLLGNLYRIMRVQDSRIVKRDLTLIVTNYKAYERVYENLKITKMLKCSGFRLKYYIRRKIF